MKKALRTAVAVTLVVCIVMMSTVSYAYDTRYWKEEFSILNRGASNPTNQVKAAQRLLQQYYSTMLPNSFVDGVFGSETQTYVRLYQHHNSLTVDGGIGPETWESMQSEISIAYFGNDITPYHISSKYIENAERSYSYEDFVRYFTYNGRTYAIDTYVYYMFHHDNNAWYLCPIADGAGTLLINHN